MDSSSETNIFLEPSGSFDEFPDVIFKYHESDKSTNLSEIISQLRPSSKISIAACPKCLKNYHNTRRTPLLLPSCGHTICYPCLQQANKSEESFSCSVCSTEITAKIQHLPINFSLLDLTVQETSVKCDRHLLEFTAFCKDEEELLCGACVFEHKTHDLCSLTDKCMEVTAIKVKIDLIDKIQTYRSWKDSWVKGIDEMAETVKKINFLYDSQKEIFLEEGSKLSKEIEDKYEEMNSAVRQKMLRVEEIRTWAKQEILGTIEEILKVEGLLKNFEALDLSEKLGKFGTVRGLTEDKELEEFYDDLLENELNAM